MRPTTNSIPGLAHATAGAALLVAIAAFLVARPDPGVPAGVAIAMPGAPQTLSVQDAAENQLALIDWAVSGVATAFIETSELNLRTRLGRVAEPRAAHLILRGYWEPLRAPGFDDPALDLHEVEITGFTMKKRAREIDADVTWRTLALSPESHTHIPGAAFAARITLRRHADQWRIREFALEPLGG